MFRTLILGISVVSLANELLGTLVSMTLAAHGLGSASVGIVMSCYWLGYIVSALTTDTVIERIGHIRAFTAFAAMVAASALLLTFGIQPEMWALCRALTGYGCAALFMVTESWLSASSTSSTRGRTFGIYMLATYVCMGAGQFLLNTSADETRLLTLSALLFATSLIPVALARGTSPPLKQIAKFGVRRLMSVAPVSALVCCISGAASGAFYGMIAPALHLVHQPVAHVPFVVASFVFGGLLAQLPVGRLSDRIDRRLVMLGTAALTLVIAVVLACVFDRIAIVALCLLTAMLGAFLSVLYPVAVAHANDRIAKSDAIPLSGALILVNGIGSFFGPVLAGLLMKAFGAPGLLGVIAVASLAMTAICLRAVMTSSKALPTRPFVILHSHAMLNPGIHPHLDFGHQAERPSAPQTPSTADSSAEATSA